MPPKQLLAEDLIIALKDTRVLEAFGAIFETKLQSVIESVNQLKLDNATQSAQIATLQKDLQSATAKIEVLERVKCDDNLRVEALETYTRRDNLLIAGLPITSYAEAAATSQPDGIERQPNECTEMSVIKLFTEQLGVPITSSDISVAHRIPRKRDNMNGSRPKPAGPPLTIVKFTNRKAREAVYAARRRLRTTSDDGPHIFINEDLCKSTADLFRRARQLVRQRVLHSAWTSSCTVCVKETGDSRPKKILTFADLPSAAVGHTD